MFSLSKFLDFYSLMKKILPKIALIIIALGLSTNMFAQSAEMDKLFNKYDSKRHFEVAEYGTEKPIWMNLIAHNASFVKILSCDAKQKSRKYKKFNQELKKSTENFNIIFEMNDKNHFIKVAATEKDKDGCMNFVIINALGEKEKVIWLYGRTNIKKFINYLKENL